MLQCKEKKETFDWEEEVFKDLINEPDFDLLYILKDVYVNDKEKKEIVLKQIKELEDKRKSEIEKERSFILS